MKKIFFLLTVTGLIACQAADEKTGKNLTAAEKANAERDSTNYTTIEWIDSTVKDLGKIKQGEVVEVSYRFKNSGDKNLIFTNVRASCGCTVPEKPEKPYAAGEEGVIKAKFDSHGKRPGETRNTVYVTANTKPEKFMQLSFRVQITE
jgi:cytochrome c oxidase assembly protein Cox11